MCDGLTQAIIKALEAPPRESIRSMVSLESLYGIYFCYSNLSFGAPFLSVDDNIDMTLPKVKRDLLIYPVSLIISPYDLDSLRRSLPAKSTNEIFPYFLKI